MERKEKRKKKSEVKGRNGEGKVIRSKESDRE